MYIQYTAQCCSVQRVFNNPIPYRNYKAQKFAMVLSSLDIHGINGSRTTLVFLGLMNRQLYSSFVERRTLKRDVGGLNPSWGSTNITILHIFSVVFRQMHLLELTFSGLNFSRFLAVANFANINSNETFCPVGYNANIGLPLDLCLLSISPLCLLNLIIIVPIVLPLKNVRIMYYVCT